MPDFDEAIAQHNDAVGNVPPPVEELSENQKRAVRAHTEYHEKMAALSEEGAGVELIEGGDFTLRVGGARHSSNRGRNTP